MSKNTTIGKRVSMYCKGLALTLLLMAGVAVICEIASAGGAANTTDPYACIRSDLTAQGMSGNIPNPKFLIEYTVPSCLTNSGYRPVNVIIADGKLRVTYKK